MIFIEHEGFVSDSKQMEKKYRQNFTQGIESLKHLLGKQFNPIRPEIILTPRKLHRVSNITSSQNMWKIEMMVKGLRPNQWPRIWFVVDGECVYFLHATSHQENYNDFDSDKISDNRFSDYI